MIADDSADPRYVAADLLNEAEHGTDSSVLLVTPSDTLRDAVDVELERQLADLPAGARRGRPRPRSASNGGCVIVADLDEAAEVANRWAPEHLQVAVDACVRAASWSTAGQRRRDPRRPAHAVLRRQLRDRLPGQPADRRLRPRLQRHHRRGVPQAHRGRPRRRDRAADG